MLFAQNPLDLIIIFPVLLIAITFHEYAHARAAHHFGDHTAARMGRLTLNPLVHLDPLGTLMLLVAGFGWGRPVPINPYAFSDYRRGLFCVSLSGPLTNFILAFAGLVVFSLTDALGSQFVLNLLWLLVFYNVLLGVFNLVPVPPLDGSKIVASLLPGSILGFYHRIEPYAPIILILLIVTGFLWNVLLPAIYGIISLMASILGFVGLL